MTNLAMTQTEQQDRMVTATVRGRQIAAPCPAQRTAEPALPTPDVIRDALDTLAAAGASEELLDGTRLVLEYGRVLERAVKHSDEISAGGRRLLETLADVAEEAAWSDGEQQSAARTVTVSVCGVPVTVPCPRWCTEAHTENYRFLEDLSHHSAEMALAAPVFSGGEEQAEQVLVAKVSSWPFADDEATKNPFLALDASGGSNVAELDATQALAFADQLVAHAAEIRRMARMLPEAHA